MGSVSRYAVGEPSLRQMDALVGRTLEHLGRAEKLANAGETLLDPGAVAALGARARYREHRKAQDGETYAVLDSLLTEATQRPWPDCRWVALNKGAIRPWVLPPVYRRIAHGPSEMLAELRPTVALFVRFGGIDYDNDPAAGAKLDAYIRWVQETLARFEGTLIDLNFGDKGSYLYANFGAPIAHENNSERACDAALALTRLPRRLHAISTVQIGVSQGRMPRRRLWLSSTSHLWRSRR